jgi:hypothetical protein
MAKLAWVYRTWGGRFPSFGTDEFARHTLVIPNPFIVTDVDSIDGWKYHPALVVVIAPWWLSFYVFSSEYRETTRRERRIAKADSAVLQTELDALPPQDTEQ